MPNSSAPGPPSLPYDHTATHIPPSCGTAAPSLWASSVRAEQTEEVTHCTWLSLPLPWSSHFLNVDLSSDCYRLLLSGECSRVLFLSEDVCIFPSLLKGGFTWCRAPCWWVFLSVLRRFVPSCSHVLFHFIGVSLSLVSWGLNRRCQGVDSLVLILLEVLWAPWIWGFEKSPAIAKSLLCSWCLGEAPTPYSEMLRFSLYFSLCTLVWEVPIATSLCLCLLWLFYAPVFILMLCACVVLFFFLFLRWLVGLLVFSFQGL